VTALEKLQLCAGRIPRIAIAAIQTIVATVDARSLKSD